MDNELQHHGILGQKWGIRRYQNEDGSLTAVGKKRYYQKADAAGYKLTSYSGGRYRKVNGKDEPFHVDPNEFVTDDIKSVKSIADESTNFTNKAKNIVNDLPSKKKARMNLDNMSDKELRERINRELAERQYNDLFNSQKESKGKEFAKKAFSVLGDTLAIGGSALTIALLIKQMKQNG